MRDEELKYLIEKSAFIMQIKRLEVLTKIYKEVIPLIDELPEQIASLNQDLDLEQKKHELNFVLEKKYSAELTIWLLAVIEQLLSVYDSLEAIYDIEVREQMKDQMNNTTAIWDDEINKFEMQLSQNYAKETVIDDMLESYIIDPQKIHFDVHYALGKAQCYYHLKETAESAFANLYHHTDYQITSLQNVTTSSLQNFAVEASKCHNNFARVTFIRPESFKLLDHFLHQNFLKSTIIFVKSLIEHVNNQEKLAIQSGNVTENSVTTENFKLELNSNLMKAGCIDYLYCQGNKIFKSINEALFDAANSKKLAAIYEIFHNHYPVYQNMLSQFIPYFNNQTMLDESFKAELLVLQSGVDHALENAKHIQEWLIH